MTDRAALIKRLRHLAEHRAKIIGKFHYDMEEWQAADEIETMARSLEAWKMAEKVVADKLDRTMKNARRR